MPKEIVAVLEEREIVVSPNLVSILRAKQKVKNKPSETGAQRNAGGRQRRGT